MTAKAALLVLGVASSLLLSGCRSPTDVGAVEQRLAALETQVADLQERNRDLRAKVKVSRGFPTGSPLADFFASPEFWECTYDSSWSDCATRCSSETSKGLQACLDNHPEGPERQKCVEDNSARGQNCLKACPVQTSPTDPPSCRGGITAP